MTTYISANVQSLADPVGRNATKQDLETVDILGGRSAGGVNIASQTSLVFRVSDEEDTLDRIEGGTSKLRHGVNGSGSTLRISLEDIASIGVGFQSSVNLVDDLWSLVPETNSIFNELDSSTYVSSADDRYLIDTCGIYSVVLSATHDLCDDGCIHSLEAVGWALGLIGTTSLDESLYQCQHYD